MLGLVVGVERTMKMPCAQSHQCSEMSQSQTTACRMIIWIMSVGSVISVIGAVAGGCCVSGVVVVGFG